MHWKPVRNLAQSQDLGTRKMNNTLFLPRGAYTLMLALAWCRSSGNYFTIWSSWYLLLGLWGLRRNRNKPGTGCGLEHLGKYMRGSKFNLAAICKMQIKWIFFTHQSCKSFYIITLQVEKLALSSTAFGNVNFVFRYPNCSMMCNSLQPGMISVFNSKWMCNQVNVMFMQYYIIQGSF